LGGGCPSLFIEKKKKKGPVWKRRNINSGSRKGNCGLPGGRSRATPNLDVLGLLEEGPWGTRGSSKKRVKKEGAT